jgi:uncharacterized membrane protein YcaP (DUF421 family)
MWFDSWSDIIRTLVVGSAAYVWLVVVLRVSGKRTLAKLNAFDLVVTVALGSTLATILLNADVSWSEGATAFVLLAAAQFVVALVTAHVPAARHVVTAGPTLLVHQGRLLDAARSNRVAEAEVMQALRSSGVGGLGEVGAVVLETDGTLSVVTQDAVGDGWALRNLARDQL